MSTGKKIVMILLALTGILFISGFILTQNTGSIKSTVQENEITYKSGKGEGTVINAENEIDWESEIQKCIPEIKNPNPSKYYAYESDKCLTNVIISSYKMQQIGAMVTKLDEAVKKDVSLYTICHGAAHAAGRGAEGIKNSNLTQLLEDTSTNTVCDWGIGHGVLYSISEYDPSTENFEEITKWCMSKKQDLRLYSLCVDGLGAVALTGGKTLKEQIQLCEKIPDSEGVSMCGSGLLREEYKPKYLENKIKTNELHEKLINLCFEWEKHAITSGGKNGCYYGVAYMYGVTLGRELSKWWNSEEYTKNPQIPLNLLQKIENIHKNNIEKCYQHSLDKDNICEKSLANQIPIRLAQDDKKTHLMLCKFFQEPAAEATCQKNAELILQ
jgi:hypothetical protein